jgi:hypothetical protein
VLFSASHGEKDVHLVEYIEMPEKAESASASIVMREGDQEA